MVNKKITLFSIFIFLFCGFQSQSQTVSELYDQASITWYGLDFTKAKIVGDFGSNENTGKVIRDVYFKAWNDLMIDEYEKYDLKRPFHKKIVNYSFEKSAQLNNEVDPDSIKLPHNSFVPVLSIEQIAQITSKYQDEKTEGIGVVFIIECFNKSADWSFLHITFFNRKNGNILLNQRMQFHPGGIGLRNYWASTIHASINKVGTLWNSWKQASQSR
jgi:hypothetical protein